MQATPRPWVELGGAIDIHNGVMQKAMQKFGRKRLYIHGRMGEMKIGRGFQGLVRVTEVIVKSCNKILERK